MIEQRVPMGRMWGLNFSHPVFSAAVGVRVRLGDRERSHPVGGGTGGGVQVSV